MLRDRRLGTALLIALVFSFALPCAAQITSGIRGTVTDSSGAAVPGARVTATNVGTGFSVNAMTSNDGTYTLTLLPIGDYKLDVAATGFKTVERTNITLTTNQVAGINVTLQVGAVSQSVEVTAGAPLVNTQTSEVGQLVNSRQISGLPLNGRNPIQLATLVNGVSGAQVPTALVGTDERNAAYMSVNGNRQYMTEFDLDGGEYSGKRMNTGLNYPNPDAIEEFRFITNNYSAEFGKNPGGVMNVVTKSGTNSYHGTLWEFNRNSDLAARNFFLPTVAPLNQNQYGVAAGGPILRNKLFFFGTAQWLKIRQGRTTTGTAPPTTAERAGDFSASAPITDPLSGKPFPNNQIPLTRLDPVAMQLINLVPLPNAPGGLFAGAFPEPVDDMQYLFKTDYNQNSRSRFTFSWFEDSTLSTSVLDFGRLTTPLVNYTGQPYKSSYHDSQDAIASHTFTISPDLLNQFRFGFVQVTWNVTDEGRGPGLVDLGSNFPVQPFSDVPTISVPGRIHLYGGNDTDSASNDFQFSDSLNWVHGRHNVKFGAEFTHSQLKSFASGNSHGALLASGSVTGNALADFELGMTGMYVSNAQGGDLRQNYIAGYVQDDFKAARNLVLNLGLRYQVSTPWSALDTVPLVDGGYTSPLSTFVPGQKSNVFVNAPVGLVYPGDPGIPDTIIHTDKHDWGPRAGLAWDVFGNGKTSLRAAYGIFYATPDGDTIGSSSYSAPFFINFNVPVTPSFVNPIPAALATAFPVPTGTNMSFQPYEPLTIQGMSPSIVNPMVQQFNVTIQQQLPGRFSVQAGWVGNVTTHLLTYTELNPAVYIPGTTASGAALSTVANTNNRRVLNMANPPASGNPLLYGAVEQGGSGANSNYHSLQVEVRKNYSHGLNMLLSYTWSKAIDDASVFLANGLATDVPQDPNNLKGSRGLASFDQSQRMVLSLLYTTPSVSRHFGFASNVLTRGLLDQWNLGTIVTLASGFPFNVTTGKDNSLTGNNADRPDLVGDPNLSTSRPQSEVLHEYFNTAAFIANPIGSYGNFGRNVLIGPGTEDVDFTVDKDFPISERLGKLQLRFEFFNFFNHPNFAAPGASLAAPTSFGVITSAGDPRIIQLGAKYIF
jgi:Carboxypeptidase regulatory-like domain